MATSQVAQAFSRQLYESAQAAGEAPEGPASSGPKPGEDAIDAEFEAKDK